MLRMRLSMWPVPLTMGTFAVLTIGGMTMRQEFGNPGTVVNVHITPRRQTGVRRRRHQGRPFCCRSTSPVLLPVVLVNGFIPLSSGILAGSHPRIAWRCWARKHLFRHKGVAEGHQMVIERQIDSISHPSNGENNPSNGLQSVL